jgi:hypothetical protein
MAGFASPYIAVRLVVPLAILMTHVGAQTSAVNGRAEYQGTAVATNPKGIPTLVYNCVKLPAICTNVNRRNPLQRVGTRHISRLQNAEYIELNFDTDERRKDARRSGACPGTWKTTHPCPETNPAQPPTVPGGASLGDGSFAAARYNPNGVQPG